MTELGAGEVIYELRKQIQKITFDLKNLDIDSKNIPELISSTNLLRSNDHLVEINHKKSELIATYQQYSNQLEQMLAAVFDIQKDLKEILKTQLSLMSEKDSKKKTKTRTKSFKK
ncbi:MAG: hypothetical protein E4G77_02900 [Nitrosopumilus sp.]|nr:MAG: hypothetical protein E4G77_02900 [Nitrosopumilus sp.]HUU48130.1 hypothetical protein [Nitrosopumilaceae archaeon]